MLVDALLFVSKRASAAAAALLCLTAAHLIAAAAPAPAGFATEVRVSVLGIAAGRGFIPEAAVRRAGRNR